MSDFRLQLKGRVRGVRQTITDTATGQLRAVRTNMRSIIRSNDPDSFQAFEEEAQERSEAAYRYGFGDGKKIGVLEGREEVQRTIEQLVNMIQKFENRRSDLLKQSEQMIVQLSLSVAKSILRREARMDPELVKNMVRESLNHVEDRNRVSIKVHPEDYQVIQDYEQEILSSAHGVKHLEIKEDELIHPGGCIIESDSGIVDAQLETQLDEIAASMSEAGS